jgi:hypothetical protein
MLWVHLLRFDVFALKNAAALMLHPSNVWIYDYSPACM